MTETFLQMAERHRAADMLAKGRFDWTGQACSIGCFNHDLGQEPGDFAALAAFTGYPEWAHRTQEALFEGLPEPDCFEFHVQFAAFAETVTDWNAVLKRTMIRCLEIALPHDTSKGRVVQRVLDLYRRDGPVAQTEWDAAKAAAWAAKWDPAEAAMWSAAGAAAADAAADASNAAAEAAMWAAAATARAATEAAMWATAGADAADAAANATYRDIRDAFLGVGGAYV